VTGRNHHMSLTEVLESAAIFGKNMAENTRRYTGVSDLVWNDFVDSIDPAYHVEASEAYLKSYTETRRALQAGYSAVTGTER
jgi:hypothetical protein